ncbi:hypothetical protein CYMTET_32398 [Cymbomonas tetramitiformis]|uniref:Uncharacterized protein n=1 Tax=Cymbomonas tetramitiformis TaxID=36881 RepID=A0AAE0KS85_9CHLO|nr:hypothetical protein CYMTET_32398 [Cymbomonas tetramitiformis]
MPMPREKRFTMKLSSAALFPLDEMKSNNIISKAGFLEMHGQKVPMGDKVVIGLSMQRNAEKRYQEMKKAAQRSALSQSAPDLKEAPPLNSKTVDDKRSGEFPPLVSAKAASAAPSEARSGRVLANMCPAPSEAKSKLSKLCEIYEQFYTPTTPSSFNSGAYYEKLRSRNYTPSSIASTPKFVMSQFQRPHDSFFMGKDPPAGPTRSMYNRRGPGSVASTMKTGVSAVLHSKILEIEQELDAQRVYRHEMERMLTETRNSLPLLQEL